MDEIATKPGADLEALMGERKALALERAHWDSWWQELADNVCPRKAEIAEQRRYPGDERETMLYDSTAVQANIVLAQGQLSLVTPMEENWFVLDPPEEIKHIPEARRWYSHCTQQMRVELANSNFYSEIMEGFLNRGGLGTCLISLQESYSDRSALVFRSHGVGSFSIKENAEGYIDTVYSCRQMSARQIGQQFGEEALTGTIKKRFDDPKRSHERSFTVHTAVYPRGQTPGRPMESSPFWWDMKFASAHWIEEPEKKMLREGGYASNPFFCSRYLKWSDDPYGWCPGWAALPEIRQLNFLERMLDTLAETQVFPRMLVPENMVDEVDFAAGGITVFNAMQSQAVPKEWGMGARYDVGLDRAKRKEQKINEAYHVDLFKMFSQMDARGQMTAREVAERSAEKVIQFSPTFARMTTELLTPILRRTFHILNARGKFSPPPMAAVQGDQQGYFVPFPEVVYVSKLALAIKTMQNTSFMSLLEAVNPLIQVDPSNMRFISPKRTIQGLAKNFGVPHDWLATEEEIGQSEQAMAEQAEQAELQAGAEAAGKVPPEMVDKLAGALQSAA